MDIYDYSRQIIKQEFFTEPYYSFEETISNIRNAINNKIPYSILRFGDAESVIAGQNTVFSLDFISRGWPHLFEDRKGFVRLPNFQLQEELLESIKNADMLAIFALDKHNNMSNGFWINYHGGFQRQTLSYYNLMPEKYLYTFANIELIKFPEWWRLFKDYKTALVGVNMTEIGEILKQYGCNIIYSADLSDHNDIDKRIEEIKNVDFDWVLCSAGASGKVFINKIKQMGKIGFDWGHANQYILKQKDNYANVTDNNIDIIYDALKNS
jgi:hypothetical protein